MNTKLGIKVLFLTLAVAAMPSLSFANPEGNQPAQGKPGITDRLGLSAEQAQELKAIREQATKQSHSLHQQLRQKRKAMQQYITSPNAEQAKAMQMFQEMNALQQKMGELRLETWFAMRKHLTPEQVQRMTQMQQQMHQRHGQRVQQGRGPDGGATSSPPRPDKMQPQQGGGEL